MCIRDSRHRDTDSMTTLRAPWYFLTFRRLFAELLYPSCGNRRHMFIINVNLHVCIKMVYSKRKVSYEQFSSQYFFLRHFRDIFLTFWSICRHFPRQLSVVGFSNIFSLSRFSTDVATLQTALLRINDIL